MANTYTTTLSILDPTTHDYHDISVTVNPLEGTINVSATGNIQYHDWATLAALIREQFEKTQRTHTGTSFTN